MRIDSHAHGSADDWKGPPEDFIEISREAGIEAAALIASLEECQAAVAKFGDYIIPVVRVPMDDCSSREVAAAVEAGARGIKFIRPRAPYADERYWVLYEKVMEMDAVAVFHTGYLGCRGQELQPAHMEHMRAAQIDVIARRFPDLRILMAHFSNPWWEEAWKVMYTRPNVYADLSGGTAFRRSVEMWAQIFAPDGKIDEQSLSKLLFAVDTRYWRSEQDPIPVGAHVEFYDRMMDRIGVSDELREAINRGTARRLFKLA